MSEETVRKSRMPFLLAAGAFALTFAGGMVLTKRDAGRVPSPSAAAAAPSAAADAGERVDFPTLGISVTRPTDWVTVTADENTRNIQSVRMDDPEFQELVARYGQRPIFAVAKYREPYPDLNPSFKITVRPIGAFARYSPEDVLTAAMPAFTRGFNDVQVLEGPRSSRLSGRNGAYARLTYTLRAGDLAVPTVSEIWVVPKGSLLVLIGAGTRADEKNGSRAEVRRILDSVQLN